MNVAALQSALSAAGYACKADGVLGPVTYGAWLSYAAQRPLGTLGVALGTAMAAAFPSDVPTDLQAAHWIAQATHETEGFRFLTEQGGAAYFARYDGRGDLGNTEPGDGAKFCGRGIFMITGRFNYRHFGAEIGEPLEDNPALAAQPGIAVKLACQFWAERRIGPLADADDIEGVTRKINGGLNGLDEREAILRRVKSISGL